jgi:hypothetical protein
MFSINDITEIIGRIWDLLNIHRPPDDGYFERAETIIKAEYL